MVREYRGKCCESVFRNKCMDGMSRRCRIDCEYKMKKRSRLEMNTSVLSFEKSV